MASAILLSRACLESSLRIPALPGKTQRSWRDGVVDKMWTGRRGGGGEQEAQSTREKKKRPRQGEQESGRRDCGVRINPLRASMALADEVLTGGRDRYMDDSNNSVVSTLWILKR